MKFEAYLCMPRKRGLLQSSSPYLIGGRCINKEWFNLPMDVVWDIVSSQLFFMRHSFHTRIHSFVLMSNHFHLLMSTPEANLSSAMAYFMRETSREIVRQDGRINQTWGGPFFSCTLQDETHFLNCYKYIYRNPVVAGICHRCESYRYSTLHGLLGQSHLLIPVEEDTLLFSPTLNLQNLEWLNRANEDDETEIRQALRKTLFKFRKENKYFVRSNDFIY